LYNLDAASSKVLTHCVPHDALTLPILGPQNPKLGMKIAAREGGVGVGESFAINETDFQTQMKRFNAAQVRQSLGQAKTVSTASGMEYISTESDRNTKRNSTPLLKRKDKGDPGELEGPNAYRGPWSGFHNDFEPEMDDATREALILQELGEDKDATEQVDGVIPTSNIKSRLITPGSEKSILHAKDMFDYQGRTYMSAPSVDVDLHGEPGSNECFIPKRCLFTYRGHTKGVNAIRLLPQTGHLLLSASMDGKVKLWDVYHDRRVLRTFLGHNKAVRDITFNNDGKQFLSASFDRYLKLWDTETGQCIQAFTTGKVPLCVKFHPDEDKQHIFLTGQQDKKIYQFDARSGEVTQEYDQHLGPVNSITFVDQNRRFVTTSDDKSLRAWEYDIPVVIKYVAEPHMHSMPSVTISPNSTFTLCVSKRRFLFFCNEMKLTTCTLCFC
jgi:pre-mRNA-processing factor 17